MSQPTRTISNPPPHYYELNSKQKRNWRHTTRRIERNQELESKYPPYHPSSNIIVIHLHHQTEIGIVDQLIKKAEETERYTLDTESQKQQRQEHGALIQIQMIHSINYSTVILIEVKYLPDRATLLYQRMKELWSIIFGRNHEIISWGPYHKEVENFNHLDLIQSGKIFQKINLQLKFQEWHDGEAHLEMESRDNETEYELYIEPSDDDDIFSYDDNNKSTKTKSSIECSLQQAVATTFEKFLDKSETLNFWQCGIDLELGTWKQKLFSRKQYDEQIEKQTRSKLEQYTIYDCTVLGELYFHMYADKANIHQAPTSLSTPTRIVNNLVNELSDISEDKLIEKLDQQEPKQTTTTTAPLSKTERQRRKNLKLKHKQRTRPDFQHKIKRPIYFKYDYRKIRAQLEDDDLHTSHQITINRHRMEVLIGFKSKHEQQRATAKMKINYFSKQQYELRWG